MAANFRVTAQRPVTDAGPGGQFVPAMEISFETLPSGVPGTVRIPSSQYAPDHVAEVLRAQAERIEAVQQL